MKFCILGPLRVENDDGEIDIGGGKLHLVLTALVLGRTKVVSTDRLVEIIWAGEPPAKPYVTVRSYISHLRRVLEPDRSAGDRRTLLVTRSPGYALEIDAGAIDAFRFEAHLGEAAVLAERHHYENCLAELSAGLELWNSDDLEDSPLAPFTAEVDRLLELRRQAVALQFDAMLELGRHHEAIPDLRALVEADPTGERHRAQLMLALYRAGRPSEAIEVHQTAVKATIDATGLNPSPTLTELEQQILTDDPALVWKPKSAAGSPSPTGVDRPRIDGPIGRAIEVTGIDQALEATLIESTGSFVAITGEPGIGKSEMMGYAAHRAGADNARVVWGFGHNGSQDIPLAPWRTLLSDMVERVDDGSLATLVGQQGPELAVLVPEIGLRLGFEPVDARDAMSINEAVCRFIQRFASEEPLLICLEDLHWFDGASVRLLCYLLPQFHDRAVAMAATWRDTEQLDEELNAALADLGRLAAGNRLELGGLDVDAVGRLWAARARTQAPTGAEGGDGSDNPAVPDNSEGSVDLGGPGSIDRTAVVELHRRTAGNPLFITELIRVGADPATLAPNGTINDVISSRLAALPSECRDLLNIGALCPGGFDEALLDELSGLDEDELVGNLELLLSARLIAEDPISATRFNFSHSLIGESLALQMSGPRKARLHTRIAETLERHRAPLGQLAHHFLQGATAGDPTTAAASALAAARSSARLHNHVSAIDLIERGLAVLDRSDDDLLRAQLMVELAHERKHLEHVTQSHAAALDGFRLAKRAGDVDLMVRAALVYCGQSTDDNSVGLHWLGYWNPPGPALDMLGQCLEKLQSGPLRAMVLLAYSSQLFGEFADPQEAAMVVEEAISEARRTPSRELLSAALHHQVTTMQRTLSYERRAAILGESLELAVSIHLTHREIAVRRAVMVLRLDENDPSAAQAEVAACQALIKDLDEPELAMVADSMAIAIDLYRGRLDEAQAAINQAFVAYERLGAGALDIFGIQLATLQREQGNLSEVENLMRWKLTGYPGPAYGMALAMVVAELGKHDEARQILADYAGDSIESGGEGVLQFMTLAFYAETLAALGDVERARTLYPAMAGAAGRTVAMFSGIAIFGSGSYYLGRLATLLGRFDEADTHLSTALDHHRRVGSRPYEVRTLMARSQLATARGDAAGANAARAEAEVLAGDGPLTWILGRSGQHSGDNA